MTTVFLDPVFKPLFKIVHDRGQQTDDRSDEFPDGWRPSNHSTYGVCERKHGISNTPKEKKKITRWKDRESEGATARLRNWKWGARETCFEQWSLTRLQCVQTDSSLLFSSQSLLQRVIYKVTTVQWNMAWHIFSESRWNPKIWEPDFMLIYVVVTKRLQPPNTAVPRNMCVYSHMLGIFFRN